MDGVMAATRIPNSPRRARVLGKRGEGVVAALAVGVTDRMDRREIEHVETQFGQFSQAPLHALQAIPGPREELIPGAKTSLEPVHLDVHRPLQRDAGVT